MFKYIGMYEEAMVFEEKRMALDPDYHLQSMAFLLKLMGRQEEAFNYYLKVYEKDTSNFSYRIQLAEAYSYLNQWESAESYYEQGSAQMATIDKDIFKTRSSFYFRYGYVLWKLGKKEKATEMFDKHIKIVQTQIDNGSEYRGHIYDLAASYAFIGEKQKAIELLDKIPFWFVTYGLIRFDPMFDQIRDDPAFQKIIQKQTDELMAARETLQLEAYSDDINRVLNR